MLRVNLSARTDVTAISLDCFSCRAHPLLILKAHSDHGRMHNSYYLVVRCVRYSWDLEGLQEKMGRTGLCYSLFPEGGKRGICLGWSGNIFLGGAANREGELVFKKRKKRRLVSSSIGPVSQAAPGTWEKFIMNVSGKMSDCFCYLFLNPAIAYTVCFWDSARWNTGHRGNIASEVSEEHICTCKQL